MIILAALAFTTTPVISYYLLKLKYGPVFIDNYFFKRDRLTCFTYCILPFFTGVQTIALFAMLDQVPYYITGSYFSILSCLGFHVSFEFASILPEAKLILQYVASQDYPWLSIFETEEAEKLLSDVVLKFESDDKTTDHEGGESDEEDDEK